MGCNQSLPVGFELGSAESRVLTAEDRRPASCSTTNPPATVLRLATIRTAVHIDQRKRVDSEARAGSALSSPHEPNAVIVVLSRRGGCFGANASQPESYLWDTTLWQKMEKASKAGKTGSNRSNT